jgi:hypothetical protein
MKRLANIKKDKKVANIFNERFESDYVHKAYAT